jgi:hypothetical protein
VREKTQIRVRLVVGVSVVVSVLALASFAIFISGPDRSRPFAQSWGSPLPSGAGVDPDSSGLVRDLVRQYQQNYGSIGVNEMPIYSVPATQATATVSVRNGCGNFLADTGRRIPIPAYARTIRVGDSPLVVYQHSTGTEWELWQAIKVSPGHWTACWGGRLDHLTSSRGVFPRPFGLAASEISYLATAITESDVASGHIHHTLALDVVDCTTPASPPAEATDCNRTEGAPAEGTIFRMPEDIPAPTGLTPFARMVFRALQHYGAVVTDHAGAVMIQAESAGDWAAEGHSGQDPLTVSWGGKPEYAVLSGIPWGRLQVLQPTGPVAAR